jgi:hypothetical protein
MLSCKFNVMRICFICKVHFECILVQVHDLERIMIKKDLVNCGTQPIHIRFFSECRWILKVLWTGVL